MAPRSHRLIPALAAAVLILAAVAVPIGAATAARDAAPRASLALTAGVPRIPGGDKASAQDGDKASAQAPDAATSIRTASDGAARKVDPRLLAAFAAASATSLDEAGPDAEAIALAAVGAEGSGLDARVYVAIKSSGPLDVGGLVDRAAAIPWPLGATVTMARVRLGNLLKLAGLPGVALIEDPAHPTMADDRHFPEGVPAGPSTAEVERRWAEILAADVPYAAAPPLVMSDRARAADAAAPDGGTVDRGSLPGAAGGVAGDGWFDARANHRSGLAWEKGWTGAGVRVGVTDTGVDFATPELVGTWATVTDAASPYFGWPQAFDSQGTYQYQQDLLLGSTGSQIGSGGVVQLVQAAPATPGGANPDVGQACFKRIRRPAAGQPARIDPDPTCDYKVPLRSRSGEYRFGPHPEPTLFTRYAGERPGLLLVDETTAGVYDTAYVDLDNDRDFVEEKPVSRSSPLIYRDMDGDGHADISGGLLYWISDGANPPPGMYLYAGEGAPPPPPAAGTVVAILGPYGGNHGTLCASNVAGQGVLPVPAGIDLKFSDLPGDGQPPYIHKGAAPGAAVVGIYRGGTLTSEAAYVYAAYGHEKDRAGDEVQVLSNSYPLRNVFEEGWDNASRLIDHLTTVNPDLAFVFSTGNGGPGYGSLRDPHPRNAIKIAASTQMGSTGYDSIASTAQIVYGDIIPFSSMGPAADGTQGPHVAADGAYASGATIVNGSANGARTVVTWGGTSRSTPVAAGNLALIYQAFKARAGRWPTWREARAILAAGARPNGYDVFRTGTGYVDGARSAFIAGGLDGLYALPDVITPGDYRGTAYPSFPGLMKAGETRRTTVTLTNPSPRPLEVDLAAKSLRRTGVHAFSWTSQTSAKETPYTASLPDYLIPVPEHLIPEGTELMAVRLQIPIEDSDLGLNFTTSTGGATPDNLWSLVVYNHSELSEDCADDDGMWHDRDDDGVVDKAVLQSSRQIDGIVDVDWANTEIDRGEFIRFGQDTRAVNNLVVWVHHPRERTDSGLYIGLMHRTRPAARPTTTIRFQLEFFAHQDWDWVAFDNRTVTVPAGGTLDVPVTVRAPAGAGPGYYQGAVFATYPWTTPLAPAADPTDAGRRMFLPLALQAFDFAAASEPPPAPTATGGVTCNIQRWLRQTRRSAEIQTPHPMRLVIPVHVNVAADLAAGGSTPLADARAQDKTQPYANAVVQGGNFWGYGNESGDWRYFFVDVADDIAAGARLVLRSQWEDGLAIDDATGAEVPRSDIDTLLYGPAPDRWTDPADPANATTNLADRAVFGPYGLAQTGGSASTSTGAGVWPFETVTGAYEEWIDGPARAGLNLVMAHNVLVSGRSFEVPFELSMDQARLVPDAVQAAAAGCTPVAFTPSFAVDALAAEGFGLSAADAAAGQPVTQDDANNELSAKWRKTFAVRRGASIDITLDGQPGTDLDLYLYRDANGDGAPSRDEQVAASGSPEPDEAIHLVGPLDGTYIASVHGWSVPAPSTFDLELLAVQGEGVRVTDVPAGGVAAGATAALGVCYDLPEGAVSGTVYHGTAFFGPAQARRLFAIPIAVTAP